MSDRRWRAEFMQAAATFDRQALVDLSRDYVEHINATATAPLEMLRILQLLRDNLQYSELMAIADAALAPFIRYLNAAGVRRHYAQALVDNGNPAIALGMYAELAGDSSASPAQRSDARGGVGRCYKEMFLACRHPARRSEYLTRAVDAYYSVYREDRTHTYHGINAAALIARAERENLVPRVDTPPARELAEDILEVVCDEVAPNFWSDVTAAEAYVALGRHDAALEWTEAFVQAEPDGYYVASFHRQLRQIWSLDTTSPPGDRLLPLLRSAMLRRGDGGEVTVQPIDVRPGRRDQLADRELERILGKDSYQNLDWYLTGLDRCRAVARIQDEFGVGIGTGFLVRGSDLHPGLPPMVLLTCGHVVPEALSPADARVAFLGLRTEADSAKTFRVVRQLWYASSARPGLDTTVLELDGHPAAVDPLPLAARLPALSRTQPPRAYLIGHPGGLDLPQFSLQDNVVLDHDDRVLHYRSPTEPGSSGSPVFDPAWKLVAIHHRGGVRAKRLNQKIGTYAANEGVTLDAIRRRMLEEAPSS